LPDKNKIMDETFQYLIENQDTIEYDAFFVCLQSIKSIPPLMDYFGKHFFEHLITMLSRIEDNYKKAELIETIMDYADEYSLDETYIKDLFDQYIVCVLKKAVSLQNVSVCLLDFWNAGISMQEIVSNLESHLGSEELTGVLVILYAHHPNILSPCIPHLLKEVQVAYRIRERSGIIAQFLLLTNRYVRKYAEYSQITFLYNTYEGVYADCWPRGLLPNRKEYLISSNILSLYEIAILEELESLINVQGENLESVKVEQLYLRFFGERDPFEVIFTLPL